MTEELYRYIDIGIKLFVIVTVLFAFYQLREVITKRHIDMYWKIAEIYYSDEQRDARRNIDKVEPFINLQKQAGLSDENITAKYNSEYHITESEDNGKIDRSIVHRIRFINQTGVLLKKKLIDKDLLFGLIGAGLEIDYWILKIVIQAHRNKHKMPYMYNDFETAWSSYLKWNEKRNEKMY